MPVPRRRAASASSSACTSFPARPTTSRRCSRSGRQTPDFRLPPSDFRLQTSNFRLQTSSLLLHHLASQLLEQPFVANRQQRLRRRLEEVEELTGPGAGVDLVPVGQQFDLTAAAGGLEQTRPELVTKHAQDAVELMDREPSTPEIREREQLEQLDRRISPFGVAAGTGLVRRD